MSENTKEKEKKNKLVVILLIIIAILLAGGVAAATLILINQNNDSTEDGTPSVTIGYQQEGVVALDPDELQHLLESMIEGAQEGMMDLSFKTTAFSEDGVNFACDFGNDIANRYDMYFNIYLGTDLEQQILLTGLIPPGGKLESFKSEIPLPRGDYEATLIFTQVDDDHATIIGQSMVAIDLRVAELEYQTEAE